MLTTARWVQLRANGGGQVRSDDGSRLWVDSMLVMDHWHDNPPPGRPLCCTPLCLE